MSERVSRGLRREVVLRDRCRCRHCGAAAIEVSGPSGSTFPTGEPGIVLTVDHIVPTSKGGHPTDPLNLQALCTRCNSRKGDKCPSNGGLRCA